MICRLIAEQIDPEIECLVGSGHGGITLASILSDRRYSNLSLVRVDSKGHGTGKSIDGYVPNSGDILEIVDDVFTTGGSLKKIYDALEPTGAIVKAAHVVVKRNDLDVVETRLPFPVTYLINVTDLF